LWRKKECLEYASRVLECLTFYKRCTNRNVWSMLHHRMEGESLSDHILIHYTHCH